MIQSLHWHVISDFVKLCGSWSMFFALVLALDDISFHVSGMPRGSKYSAVTKDEPPKAPLPIEVPALLLDELKEKTDNFGPKALVGEGSYGRVYLAVLDDGKQVALKKLDSTSEPEANTEFLTQVSLSYSIILNSHFLLFCVLICRKKIKIHHFMGILVHEP